MASNYDVHSPPDCENNLQYKSIFNILKFLTISTVTKIVKWSKILLMMIQKVSMAILTIITMVMISEAWLFFSQLQQSDGNTNVHVQWCLFAWLCLTPLIYISVISWLSILLVEETEGSGENQRPVASHWQTLSHNVVHLILTEIRTQ